MADLEPATPISPLDPRRLVKTEGFGDARFSRATGYLVRPSSVAEVAETLRFARENRWKVTLRGAGRSYGDANIGRETILLDLTRMRRILDWNPETGVIEVEAGVSFEQIWRLTLEDGYWLPVVSGTMYPSVGGALAMNIHGKNNFCMGTLGEHVLEMDVLLPDGRQLQLSAGDPRIREFVSSAGLLGVITRVNLQMKRVPSGDLDVYAESAASWDQQFELFERFESSADYIVSWVDAFGRGRNAGRGLFHAAIYPHDRPADPRTFRPEHQDLPDTILGLIPKSVVWRALKLFCNRRGMKAINAAKYHSGRLLGNRKWHTQSLVCFSFLLDYVPNWRRAYAPHGFIQYQSFVPKEHAKRVFDLQIQLQQSLGLESFLGVLKRHRPDDFLFSHAVDGYSLAFDFKVTPRTWPALQRLATKVNQIVIQAGGRLYFAKDSTMSEGDARAYLGESWDRFQALKAEYDPDGVLTHGLAERIGLTP